MDHKHATKNTLRLVVLRQLSNECIFISLILYLMIFVHINVQQKNAKLIGA